MADVAVRTNDSTLSAVNTHDGLTGIVRDFIYSIGFPSVFVASLIEGRGIGRYTSNTEIFNRTTATRGQVTYSQPAANGLVGVDATVTDFVPSAMEIYYFNKTMDLFAAAHIRVMLLTVPVSETTIREIKPSNNAAFTALLGKRLSWDNNIAADLSRLVAWPDELYVDGSHLNDHGARIFSGRLAACLQGWDEGVGRSIPCDLTWK